jgi:6-phosphogluconolactonase (cycloisomerase 2 family)
LVLSKFSLRKLFTVFSTQYLNILADKLISDRSTKWKQIGITVAGDNNGAVDGDARQLSSPYDLAFDSKNQYFYVADYANGRIQRYPVNGSDNRAGVTVLQLNESTV